MSLPRIPDEAFLEVLNRIGTFLDVADSADAGHREAGDNFCRALGLDGERDERVWNLAQTVIAHLRGVELDSLGYSDIQAGNLGVTFGLLLAQATGWSPPMETGTIGDEGPTA
jgi:hypothetical protein